MSRQSIFRTTPSTPPPASDLKYRRCLHSSACLTFQLAHDTCIKTKVYTVVYIDNYYEVYRLVFSLPWPRSSGTTATGPLSISLERPVTMCNYIYVCCPESDRYNRILKLIQDTERTELPTPLPFGRVMVSQVYRNRKAVSTHDSQQTVLVIIPKQVCLAYTS